jgi:hypothetical protein
MSADPKQVMRILDYRGIDVRLEDGQMIARCRRGQVPPDMISFIRYFRDLIVAEIEARKVAA